MGQRRQIVRGGTVLTLDPELGDIAGGEVLIEGSEIEAVGKDLEAGDAEVIEVGSDSIVLPGFVDTHRHTWQAPIRNVAADWILGQYMTGVHIGLSKYFRPEDTYAGNLLGTVEALDSGITTLLDWSHNLATPEHADAAIEGLRDSGARAVFAHGGGAPQWQVPSDIPHPDDAKRVKEQYFSSDDQLLTMAMALRGPQFTSEEVTLGDYALAREIDTRITLHVGDGEFGKTRPVAWLKDRDLLGPDATYVHCNMLGDDELRMIADSGGTASVSADIELSMGHGWPATGRLIEAGVRPSLSIDVCTLNGGDMFGAMKATVATERAIRNAEADERGTVVEDLAPSCRDAVAFATVEGARANGLLHKVGTLTPGKEADLIVLRTDSPGMYPVNNPYGAIVYSAHPGVVDTVMVAGNLVKRGGQFVQQDMERLRRLAYETRDYLFEQTKGDGVISDAAPGGKWTPAALRAQ